MNSPIRVYITWPNGQQLPIKISPYASGAELLRLAQLSSKPSNRLCLFFDSKKIDNDKNLINQGIQMDDILNLIKQSKDEFELEIQKKNRIQNEIQSIYFETLRLQDIQMDILDTQLIQQHQNFSEYSDSIEDEDELTLKIPKKKSIEPIKEPLPKFWESQNEDDEIEENESFLNQFSTIEEASAYFSKEKWIW